VITGQDISLDILVKHIEKKVRDVRPLREYVGSLDSLISMYQGHSDIVSTHLLDGDTGEYNLPYIRKFLIGFTYVVINLVSRPAGLYVQKGNPKQIFTWSDLKQQDLIIINREKGSGARILLDEQLRLHGISSNQLEGYDIEESNHMGVAGRVALGEADVGVGIEKAAHIVTGVDFIPLIQERYDIVMLKTPQNLYWIEKVKQILKSDAFKHELKSIQGYDLSRTGEVILET
jgi:putative molybdopterin biosynthesis protein